MGLPRDERLCPTCLVVEDEEHFLFNCNKYNVNRNKHIENLNIVTIYDVFNVGCKADILKLANYVKACLSG